MPNGKVARSERVYIRAWKELYEPFCELIGAECIGFDSDLLLRYVEGGPPFEVPVHLAQKILMAIAAKEKH